MSKSDFTLAVFGSRSLNGTVDRQRVTALLIQEIDKYGVTRLAVAGEPEGVCLVVRVHARRMGYPLTLHFIADVGYRRGGAWDRRTYGTIKDSQRALLIWDTRSKGTGRELMMCSKHNLPYTLHELLPDADSEAEEDKPMDWGARLLL